VQHLPPAPPAGGGSPQQPHKQWDLLLLRQQVPTTANQHQDDHVLVTDPFENKHVKTPNHGIIERNPLNALAARWTASSTWRSYLPSARAGQHVRCPTGQRASMRIKRSYDCVLNKIYGTYFSPGKPPPAPVMLSDNWNSRRFAESNCWQRTGRPLLPPPANSGRRETRCASSLLR